MHARTSARRERARSWGLQQSDRHTVAMPGLRALGKTGRARNLHKPLLPCIRVQVNGTTARAFPGTVAKRQAHGCNAARGLAIFNTGNERTSCRNAPWHLRKTAKTSHGLFVTVVMFLHARRPFQCL
eukprot:6265784-Lingulodinium_polyedra.AAC.1